MARLDEDHARKDNHIGLRRVAGVAAVLGIVSCASPGVAPRSTSKPSPSAAPTSNAAPAPQAAPFVRAHHVVSYPERRPELGLTTPMKGEPSSAVLATEARLVSTTCDKATNEEIDARVRQMRAAVDVSFKEWHDQQPSCWAQMREEYILRREAEKRNASGSMWGSAIGDSFGAGGLGLSGVGQGGGGVGAGIGLGHGRLSGEHKSSSDGVRRSEPRAARSASGTNNQVAGVDEADIVKTDGKYVYFAANGALRIALAMNPRMVSVTKLNGVARELFVEGDRAVVYTANGNGSQARRCTYGYDCAFGGDGTITKVSVFDISDRTAPKVTREIELSGSLIAARRIGNAIHTVVADNDDSQVPAYATWPADMDTCGVPEATVRAKFAALKAENEKVIRARRSAFPSLTEQGKTQPICNILRPPIRDGQAFTSVVSFDLTDDKSAPTTATLQSRPGAVFASGSALYVSVVHRKANTGALEGKRWYSFYSPSVDEVSEIHKFRIGATPTATKYVGSGTVPGHVLNQFSMDEWYGYLRVATTKGRVPDPNVESALSILAETESGSLARIGAIEKIAPGEDIRSVRFDDDRGYVVTFKKTDPLFVMDLFEPAKPRILGELKIPGFSTYMHRIDQEHLLSIGFDANDHGSFAYFDGVILQLFDVKNPTDPRLLHKEKIGSRGSSSEAATDHLAFNYLAGEGLLAIPMTMCEGGGDGQNGQLSFSGLLVYDVDIERGFTRLGGVDHGTKGVNCSTWWSNATSMVKRSVFLDDLVYSIATDRVKVQRMGHFGLDVADLSMVP